VPDYDYGTNTTLHVFNLTKNAKCTVYDVDGEHAFTVLGEKNGDTLSFSFDKLPNGAKILLRGISNVASVTGASFKKCELGALLTLTDSEISIKL
jgi:alpha-D-xyloside xylohydrolase